MYFQKVGSRFVNGIELAQVRDRWRALVTGLMNLQVS